MSHNREMPTKTSEKKKRRMWRRRKRYALTGIFLTVFLVAGVLIWKQFNLGERIDAIVNKDVKRLGPDDAAVKIVEYSDFQCPVCARAQPILKELMDKYAGKIRLEFRHFPLSAHKWAALAHQAAECANQVGHFWEYHDLLYDNQSQWSVLNDAEVRFKQYAKDLGLNAAAFTACLKDGKVTKIIKKDRNSGTGRQVRSTPTFFVNNSRIVGVAHLKRSMELEIGSILRKLNK